MSLSPISSIAVTQNQPELQKPTPAAVAPQQAPASLPTDTVSISPAAQKAASSGDVDRDGDSH